jgi:3'5'-cyclic nucleotide phosphodiesterase
MKEEPHMAALYGGKCVAEQNSLDLTWSLLMSNQFDALRNCIFASKSDLMHFRQVLVNAVLATDMFDKELNEQRDTRWEKAFSITKKNDSEISDMRATLVIELLMQASDVAHTMQHWQVYRKWNKKLFNEMMFAYRAGRMTSDPSTFWYQGELSFFDNFVVPVARKLKECKVFGVSGDDYLIFAEENRREWESRGRAAVEEMIQEFVDFNGLG